MLFFIFSVSTLPLCLFFSVKPPFFTSTSAFCLYFFTLTFLQKLLFIIFIFIFIIIPTLWFFYKTSTFCVTKTSRFRKLIKTTKLFMFSFQNIFSSPFYPLHLSTFRWKPLFKKTSYFGVYKANRNKWLNN